MKTTNTDESSEAKLVKLRERQSTLNQRARQLQARAEHLNRVKRGQVERLARRVDAHEKIVLGALVKKARLDVRRVDGVEALTQQRNDVVLSSIVSMVEEKNGVQSSTLANQKSNDVVLSSDDCRVYRLSTSYDRELILGALLWLASALNQPPGDVSTVLTHDVLREAGRLAGANVG